MIAGIEGLHAWTPPGASEPAVVLGQRSGLLLASGSGSGDDVGAPRLKIVEVGGLHALSPTEDNRDPRIGDIGSTARPSERREKSVTYTGVLEAETLRELREGEQLLRDAFAEVNREGRMDVAWHPDNDEFADAPPVFYEARPVLCEIVDRQVNKRWHRPVVIGLVLGDPRHFEADAAHSVEIKESDLAVDFT